jgi:hypothetical protein
MEREGAPVDPIGGSSNASRAEIALPDGAVIELEQTEFTARQDTVEAKVQDGKRYQGLLSREDYDRRKRRLGEVLRADADPEAYRREKLKEAIEREDEAKREADEARRKREDARKEKRKAELEANNFEDKDGEKESKKKKNKKKKKASAMLSFEEVDE